MTDEEIMAKLSKSENLISGNNFFSLAGTLLGEIIPEIS